jgi:hypothetical protein
VATSTWTEGGDEEDIGGGEKDSGQDREGWSPSHVAGLSPILSSASPAGRPIHSPFTLGHLLLACSSQVSGVQPAISTGDARLIDG